MKKDNKDKKPKDLYIKNRSVRHDYNFSNNDIYEAGIALEGYEIKSIMLTHTSLSGAYCKLTDKNEIVIVGMFVKKYENGSVTDSLNEYRDRKLLLNKSEIKKIAKQVREKGWTIVPVNIHLSQGGKTINKNGIEVRKKKNIIKLDIAVAQGAKSFDKRENIKNRDNDREQRASLKRNK